LNFNSNLSLSLYDDHNGNIQSELYFTIYQLLLNEKLLSYLKCYSRTELTAFAYNVPCLQFYGTMGTGIIAELPSVAKEMTI